jgi:hypothetical protein
VIVLVADKTVAALTVRAFINSFPDAAVDMTRPIVAL